MRSSPIIYARLKEESGSEETEDEIKRLLRLFRIWVRIIDHYGGLILLLTYVAFNVVYWTWLMTASEYGGWSVNTTWNALDE